MALSPGLRFQIVLILGGLAAVSTFLSTMVAVAAADRVAAQNRLTVEETVAAAAASLIAERCPGDVEHEPGCAAAVVRSLSTAVEGTFSLVDSPGGTPVSGTSHALVYEPDGREGAAGVRRLLLLFAALNFAVLLGLGFIAMLRGVVRPVEALAGQVDRVGRLELGEPPGGHQLGRLGTSFRRMVGALATERERVERQIDELEATNASLQEARDGLVRSEKLAAVGRLSAGLAHEIGNPLGGLIGYLELLKTRLAGDEVNRELVMGALASCQRIDRAIRDLLDFARPQEGRPGPFDTRLALDEAARLVGPRLGEARLEIDAADEDCTAVGERGGMVQVLVNLVLNAVDAMEGSGTVRLVLRRTNGNVSITVTDEGPGIPLGSEEEIFEPFFTTKEPGKGTGLGLAISRRIVESWGGRLEAKSKHEPGLQRQGRGVRGARFEVLLEAAGTSSGREP